MLKLTLRLGLPSVSLVLLVLIVAAAVVGQAFDARELAYLASQRSQGRGGEIHLMDIERGLNIALTSMFSDISTRPQWTPDGNSLIFAARDGQRSDVYTLNLKTRHLNRLTTFDDSFYMQITEVAPSYDGKLIAFLRVEDTRIQNQLYVMNIDGSDMRQLRQGQGNMNSSLNWSPNDHRLIFTAFSSTSSVPELWLVDLRGSQPAFRRVMGEEDGMGAITARWSGEREQIGILSVPTESGQEQTYMLINVETGEVDQTLAGGVLMRRADWSQDGTKLVYVLPRYLNTFNIQSESIILRNIDNQISQEIIELPPNVAVADIQWSLDESRLAITANLQDAMPQIFIIQMADGEIVQTTQQVGQPHHIAYGPAWRP